ncbi:MAG: hypothetical protein HY336_00230 [Candidatus Doudnabacteria bacterium]|nr:hypothetical protein [Candidatus Doudnabacteria bacterium]
MGLIQKLKIDPYRVSAVALLVLTALLVQRLPRSVVDPKYLTIDQILANGGTVLPVEWGDIGTKLIEAGALDEQKLMALYGDRRVYEEFANFRPGKVKLTRDNSQVFLNFLWALGLSNKNEILEKGEMANPNFKVENFASTGGFSLSSSQAMDHYSRHEWINLNPGQQAMLEHISKKIFRPCCDNSTHFPDCNHGMAMLGLLTLAVSQNLEAGQIYDLALAVNVYWFENNYRVVEQYLTTQGLQWTMTAPEEILSKKYSSGSAYQRMQKMMDSHKEGATSCGVR